MCENLNIKSFLTGFRIYYYIHVLAFRNKLKSTSKLQLILYLTITLGGVVFLYRIYFSNDIVSQEPPLVQNFHVLWLILAFFFVKLLISSRFSINAEDSYLLSVTRRKLNDFLFFRFISNNSKVFYFIFSAAFIAVINESTWHFVYSFCVIYVFYLLMSSVSELILFFRFFLTNRQNTICNVSFCVLLGLAILAYFGEIKYPLFFFAIFEPIIQIVDSLFSRYQFSIELNLVPFLVWIGGITTMFMLLVFMSNRTDLYLNCERGEGDDKKQKNKPVVEKDMLQKHSRFSLLFMNEIMFLKSNLLSYKGILNLMMSCILYIGVATYAIYNDNKEQNFSNIHINSVLPMLFAVISIPLFYIMPLMKGEKNYLWLYRLRNISVKRFVIVKLVSSYAYCQIGLLVSTIFVILLLRGAFSINYFMFTDKLLILNTMLFTPVLVLGFVIYLAIFLPEIYFQAGSSTLKMIPMITLIYFSAMLVLPTTALIMLGFHESKYYYFLSVLSGGFLGYVIYLLLVKFIKRKEL